MASGMAVRVTVYHVMMDFGMMRAGRVLRALAATGQQHLLRREGGRRGYEHSQGSSELLRLFSCHSGEQVPKEVSPGRSSAESGVNSPG